MFQFAKFEKSKERRLATELGYGFPIGDPWITDGISPWPFASESVLPSQCPGIHPMHSFRSCTRLLRIGYTSFGAVHGTPNPISTKKMKVEASTSLTASIPDVNGRLILVRLHTLYKINKYNKRTRQSRRR
ncbi:uncharacterized mitochondrial protein atmg00030 [Phtheirospermum japonicum]|uniref:Uncharacterized mitochondrial protein atmg00030 n=1 Tax=Phtheirospermum japonicum TaxID=374723 RepID=A0A830DPY1_9LAMI|nr:uncharacterized mitochondrial protein atmg00030 [Phtheirospermum japonicum]